MLFAATPLCLCCADARLLMSLRVLCAQKDAASEPVFLARYRRRFRHATIMLPADYFSPNRRNVGKRLCQYAVRRAR